MINEVKEMKIAWHEATRREGNRCFVFLVSLGAWRREDKPVGYLRDTQYAIHNTIKNYA